MQELDGTPRESVPSAPSSGTVEVVHRDDRLVVVDKPPGMLVHRGMGASRNEVFLLQTVRDMIGAWVYPVHRLDRPTRGLVVFALAPEFARELQDHWQNGLVAKRYLAIARGWPTPPSGIHEEALDDPDSGILHDATTGWSTLGKMELPWACGPHPGLRLSFLDLVPHTGRWHQLRRHLSRKGHPIVGDTTHGDRHVNHLLRDRLGWWGLHLDAVEIMLPIPGSANRLRLTAPEDSPHRTAAAWKALAAWSIDQPPEFPGGA
ncbi:MAG: pseudouridylate synthase [Fibrobacteria bacterium]|nr:pseudouridylate synthase [Fibrobacteria bacterium]